MSRRFVILAALVIGACGGEDAPKEPLVLTDGDACGEAFFWAATTAGDTAVTVYVDVRDRGAVAETYDLPDPAVTVEVLRGSDLPRNMCTDVLDLESEPTERISATAGHVEIEVTPSTAPGGPSCGTADGTLRLTDLVADDGTTFEPIEVTSASIGCYQG
jgi:hypothetical protein